MLHIIQLTITAVKIKPYHNSHVKLVESVKRYYSRITEDSPVKNVWCQRKEEPEITCKGNFKEGSGLILGVYSQCQGNCMGHVCLTKTANKFNNSINGKLVESLKLTPIPATGETRVNTKLDPSFDLIVVTGLGDAHAGYNKQGGIDEGKENIRKAVGAGVRHLHNLRVNRIYVEGFDDPESAAEGVHMAIWEKQQLRGNGGGVLKKPHIYYMASVTGKNGE